MAATQNALQIASRCRSTHISSCPRAATGKLEFNSTFAVQGLPSKTRLDAIAITSPTAFRVTDTGRRAGPNEIRAATGQEPAAGAEPNDADLEVLGRIDVWRFSHRMYPKIWRSERTY
jgi:hypothetical protein